MKCECYPLNSNQGACFSEDRKHRYLLWRKWSENPGIAFLLLNPSIADENILDPTLKRCKQFANDNGFGSMIIMNVFSIVSTDPKGLRDLNLKSHYISSNLQHINYITSHIPIILGFGTNADKYHPGFLKNTIYPILKDKKVYSLKVTKNGLPSHPLYLPANSKMMTFHLPT
jgi:hypothetical protein